MLDGNYGLGGWGIPKLTATCLAPLPAQGIYRASCLVHYMITAFGRLRQGGSRFLSMYIPVTENAKKIKNFKKTGENLQGGSALTLICSGKPDTSALKT